MPNYDDATAYLYCYAEELVKFAEEKNILHLLAKQDEPGAMASAMLIWNNMTAQEVLGNEQMRCS